MRQERTHSELRKMAREHVRYELQMMRLTAAGLKALRPDQVGERNVLIESFLLHTRNLRDFLHQKQGRDDTDALAVDFFDDPSSWLDKRPEPAEAIRNNRERMNRALAHLSYSRLEYESSKTWAVSEMRQGIEDAFSAFLKALPEERAAWFQD